MKKILTIVVLAFLSSCGLKYTSTFSTTPLEKIDFTSDIKREERKCAYNLFWFPPFAGSDISVVSIAREAKFKKVILSDNQSDFFVLYNRVCTVVYGE